MVGREADVVSGIRCADLFSSKLRSPLPQSQAVDGTDEMGGKWRGGPTASLTAVFLQALRDKTNELEIKVDRETNSLKAAVEQTKNEAIKYCLGLMLGLMTVGLGAARMLI